MSSYLSIQDYKDYLPQQIEDKLLYSDDTSTISDEWAQEDINSGESIIESYIGKYYTLPATEVDNPTSYGILRRVNTDISVYYSYQRWQLGMPEETMYAYEQAIKQLKDLRDEKSYLPDMPVLEDSGVGKSSLFSNVPMFQIDTQSTFY
jgi:phage gp36-like protein